MKKPKTKSTRVRKADKREKPVSRKATRAQRVKLVRQPTSVAPPPSSSAAAAPAPGLRVGPEVVASARARRGLRRRLDDWAPADRVFAPYAPPQFVQDMMKRAGAHPTGVAMDSVPALSSQWAGSLVSSAVAEGMTFLGYPNLAEMAQRPEYRVVSETIAEECTRKWIKLKAKGDDLGGDKAEKIGKVEEEMERLDVQGAFRRITEQDGLFGRAHLYVDTGDGDSREELKLSIGDGSKRDPISRRKFRRGKLVALRPIEAVWTYPVNYNSIDPLAGSWYEPQTWFVMGKEVHATRLLKFVGREVPDLLKPAYSFGGLSLSQMLKPYVDNWLGTRQAVADIVQSFSQFVLKTNLQAANLAVDGQRLWERIDLFNLLRSNQGLMVLDKGTEEEFDNVSAPLGTLDVLQAQTQEHIAAVARIPLVKLLGITPNGLNASSEGEIRVFYDTIAALQKRLLDKHLRTIINLIQLSLFGEVDDDITYEWNPLWALDEKGQAEVDKIRADTGAVLIESGAVDAEEERRRVANDPASAYPGLDLSKEIEEPGPDPEEMAQQMKELGVQNPAAEEKQPSGEGGGEFSPAPEVGDFSKEQAA